MWQKALLRLSATHPAAEEESVNDYQAATLAALPDERVVEMYRRHARNARESMGWTRWDETDAARMYLWEAERRGIAGQLVETETPARRT